MWVVICFFLLDSSLFAYLTHTHTVEWLMRIYFILISSYMSWLPVIIVYPSSCPLLLSLFTYILAPSCVLTFVLSSSQVPLLWFCSAWIQKDLQRTFHKNFFFFPKSQNVKDLFLSLTLEAVLMFQISCVWSNGKKKHRIYGWNLWFYWNHLWLLWFSSFGEALHDVLLVLCRFTHYL